MRGYGSGFYDVNCARFQIDQDGPRCVISSTSFVIVDVDSLQLEGRVSNVLTRWVNAMLISNYFPELKEINTYDGTLTAFLVQCNNYAHIQDCGDCG